MLNLKQLFFLLCIVVIGILLVPGKGSIYTPKPIPLYDTAYTTTNPSPLYETEGHKYYDGEILLPDYVHIDTLIVVDAKYLNWAMTYYDAASDGDIAEILYEGCWTREDIMRLMK